jgi:hypothetical protein
MKKIKISAADKALIKAYCKWWIQKGYLGFPSEYDIACLIDNKNGDHRNLIEDYLEELKAQYTLND